MQASTDQVEIIPPPNLPAIDAFEYQQASTAGRVWQVQPGLPGTVAFYPDASRHAPGVGSTSSLHIHTHTPCANPRYEQISDFLLGGGVDLSAYNSLEMWVGGDLMDSLPYGGEFTIMLEDADGEHWQSTHWLSRKIQGQESLSYRLEPVRFSLLSFTADPTQSPWLHPADFVLTADGNTFGNHQLDIQWIRSITLKTLTTDNNCSLYPDYDIWVDKLSASTAVVTPPQLVKLPVIDNFEYPDNQTARLIWSWSSSGTMNITTDTTIHAPGSAHSMHIFSSVPASNTRYAQVINKFIPGMQDLSSYSKLSFWARTTHVSPYGGELSIELVETDPDTGKTENWRNTRWFGNSDGVWIEINLTAGANTPSDPWESIYQNAFVISKNGSYVDGILNLAHITEIRVIALTTDVSYPNFDLWIDEMKVQ